MDAEIIRVTDQHEIAAVSALAEEIWRQHFIPIIGEAQVKYMLAKFQSMLSPRDLKHFSIVFYLLPTCLKIANLLQGGLLKHSD